MAKDCEFLSRCGFFRKFSGRKSAVWKGMIGFYCRGGAHKYCERVRHYRAGVMQCPDQMMPTGKSVPEAFLQLG